MFLYDDEATTDDFAAARWEFLSFQERLQAMNSAISRWTGAKRDCLQKVKEIAFPDIG